MKRYLVHITVWVMLMLATNIGNAQLDSIVKAISDSVVHKLIVDDIPRKTFKDRFMYPHRWYIKQLLKPRNTDFDTTYITSNKRKLTLTIPISKKFYGVNFIDPENNRKLKISPNNYYNIGFNFSNIFLTFAFVPPLKIGAKPGRGNTKSTDLQITIIGHRVITDINYQNYKGMYIHSNDFSQDHSELIDVRPEIKIISYGVNTMFVYNYKKYSLRGAFSFTDVQRKSAGSFMTGLYHSHVDFNSGDSAFLKYPLTPYFSQSLYNINKLAVIVVGLSGGYGYTFVHNKMIFSTAINIGAGGQKTNFTKTNHDHYKAPLNLAIHLNAKAALRYDNLKFFVGVLAAYDTNYTPFVINFNTENYIGKVVVFSGYRFNLRQNGRKVLKAMKLVDYNM